MPAPRTLQELIRGLETGRGGRLLALAALAALILVLSLLVAWKQFHGPGLEDTLVRADMGRQLARGEGFSTLVNYPQSAALLQSRGQSFDKDTPYPELHHAPLYSLFVAGGLRLLPGAWREAVLGSVPPPPDGYGGDYFLLGLNLLLLWVAAFLTHRLGSRLFSAYAGFVACAAFLVSVSLWERAVSVDGSLLLVVLVLLAFDLQLSREEAREEHVAAPAWLAIGTGLVCGLLFLAEYSAGFASLFFLVLVFLPGRAGHPSWRGGVTAVITALLLVLPWVWRNVSVSGSPVGLAWQALALRSGDTVAEPGLWLNSLDAGPLPFSANKLGNKLLTGIQETLRTRLWSGGGLLLTGFFIAGCLYRFRDQVVNRMRLQVLGLLGLWVAMHALCTAGAGEATPAFYLAPLVMVLGAGFFQVLVESSPAVSSWPRAAAGVLLGISALPLLHDALEPRRIHFHYPPYYPSLFVSIHEELGRRSPSSLHGLMADVPAGVAWYGRHRVWAQPILLRDFYRISADQPVAVLVLTPKTLDRPFFSELTGRSPLAQANGGAARQGEWGEVYSSFFTGRLPAGFPLRSQQKLADNLFVLSDPSLPPARK